jgi:hypothetical protein
MEDSSYCPEPVIGRRMTLKVNVTPVVIRASSQEADP